MSSPAQILSNRQNATHSTGPKTEAGKHNSKLNATKHGLSGQTVVLPTEDAEAYAAFRSKLFVELTPKSTTEEMLVQTIVDTHWRLERARRLETNVLTLAHYEELPAALTAIEDRGTRNAMIEAQAALKQEKVLQNLQLQEARLQRALFKAMAELREQQARRKAHMVEALDAKLFHEKNDLPFDPANLGFVFTADDFDQELTRRKIHYASAATFSPGPVRPYKSEQPVAEL